MPYKYNNFKINGGFSVKCECGVALIKTSELANKWGVSKDTLDYHTRKNGLPFTNAGYPVTASDVFYNKPLSLRKAGKILGVHHTYLSQMKNGVRPWNTGIKVAYDELMHTSGQRQGTNGITEKLRCEDESNLWYLKRYGKFGWVPESWVDVPAWNGEEFERRPLMNNGFHMRENLRKIIEGIVVKLSKSADPNLTDKLPWKD